MFNNTPGLRTVPSKPVELTGKALVDQLEKEYLQYREDCNKGYCQYDADAGAAMRAEITQAKAKIICDAVKQHQKLVQELYDGNPSCQHEFETNSFSGVKCKKCGGWLCY